MLTILAYRTTWKELEIYEFEPVNLTYAFTDITEVNKPTSGYSQTFRVPLTPKNEDVFGPYTLAQVPAYDLKEKIPARLLDGGVTLMQGYIQVKNWYITKGKFIDIEVAFFGEAADFSRTIGDSLLSDLDWSSYDHLVNYTNVTGSWTGSLSSGEIRYGLVDRGQNWNGNNNPNEDTIQPGDLTPFISVKAVLDKIFTTAGFTYESTHFTTFSSTLYTMLHSGGIGLKYTTAVGFSFWVGRTTNITITTPTAWTDVNLQETGNFNDIGADYATPNWTVPFSGVYGISFYFNHTVASAGTVSFRLYDGTTAIPIATSVSGNFIHWYYLQNEFTAGATWRLQVQSSGPSVTLVAGDASGILGVGGTSWRVNGSTSVLTSVTLDTARNMPKMRQIDFLMGLQKCFNLVFIPDRFNPKKIYIEPFNDYMASGDKKDWTNKIDLNQDISISTTADIQARTYNWTHSEGEDFISAAIQASGRVYGRHQILDPSNAFATGEMEINSGFAPYITSYIPTTGLNIHRLITSDSQSPEIKEIKPRLAWWNSTLNYTIKLNNAGTPANVNYPFFGAFKTNGKEDADVPDDSLMFGIELPFFQITANPYDTLYNKYWQVYANQLYSSDARVLTATFLLDSFDISIFEFNDKIYLFDTYWRVLEISGYDPTTDKTVTVKLLKILGTIRDCTYLPSTGRTGRIEFTTSTGSSISTVNRTCCERYGFIYDAGTAYCYQP
jgi:hypothetical protein